MGFEPTTPTLARLCSTPELRPHPADPYHTGGGGVHELARPQFCQPPVLQTTLLASVHAAPHRGPHGSASVHFGPALRAARCARHSAPHLCPSAGLHSRRGGLPARQ